jgi:hypothetical protein
VLAGTNLARADLRGSDLRGALLKDADLSHAARARDVLRSEPIINLSPTARRGRTHPTAITGAACGWRSAIRKGLDFVRGARQVYLPAPGAIPNGGRARNRLAGLSRYQPPFRIADGDGASRFPARRRRTDFRLTFCCDGRPRFESCYVVVTPSFYPSD